MTLLVAKWNHDLRNLGLRLALKVWMIEGQ